MRLSIRHSLRLPLATAITLVLLVSKGAQAQCGYNWRSGEDAAGFDNAVLALTVYNGELIAAGDFIMAGGVPANRIARWNGVSWQALGSGTNGRVRSLGIYDGDLIAGGDFTIAGGVPAGYLARWNGSNWAAIPGAIGGISCCNSAVTVMETFDDGTGEALYVGGEFTTIDGAPFNHIARWDGQSWSPLGSGLNDEPVAMAVSYTLDSVGGGFRLHVAGWFTSPSQFLATWTGSSWSFLGLNFEDVACCSAPVSALEANGSTSLYVGGEFTLVNTEDRRHILHWNLATSYPLGIGLNNEPVALLIARDGNQDLLYAGGYFSNSVARWNGSSWQSLGSGTNGAVIALAEYNKEIIVGGEFSTAGGNPTPFLARWGPECPRGDMNCDQAVDVADVPLFVNALLNAPTLSTCEAYTANVNGDVHADGTSRVDGNDVQAFVNCLLGGPCP